MKMGHSRSKLGLRHVLGSLCSIPNPAHQTWLRILCCEIESHLLSEPHKPAMVREIGKTMFWMPIGRITKSSFGNSCYDKCSELWDFLLTWRKGSFPFPPSLSPSLPLQAKVCSLEHFKLLTSGENASIWNLAGSNSQWVFQEAAFCPRYFSFLLLF